MFVVPGAHGVVDGAEDLYKLVRHPLLTGQEAAQGLYLVFSDPRGTAQAVYMQAAEFNALPQDEQMAILSRFGGHMAFDILTGKALLKAKELAKLKLLSKEELITKGRRFLVSESGAAGFRGAVPKTGELLEWTFGTAKGPVGMLAEVVVEGDTLVLKDVVVYAHTEQPLKGLLKDVLAAKSQLVNEAKAWGFTKLRITGQRVM